MALADLAFTETLFFITTNNLAATLSCLGEGCAIDILKLPSKALQLTTVNIIYVLKCQGFQLTITHLHWLCIGKIRNDIIYL